jgi:hypothetical protein
MDFALRDAVEDDVNQFLALVSDRFLYDEASLSNLRAMWQYVIASRSGFAHVIADADDPSRVIHFGCVVFVNDEKAARFHRCERPKIAFQLLDEWHRSGSAFLSQTEIAGANAGAGLNLVVAHHGYVEPPDAESLEKLRFASNEHSVRDLRGWNLRSFTNEVFAANPQRDGKQSGEALGFRVGEYSAEQLREAGIPEERKPYLCMATRQDLGNGPVGLALGMLFRSFDPPRFGFSTTEQGMLRLALDGHTDVTIAGLTHMSLTMAKKHFRAIYDKVAMANPFESETAPLPSTNGSRGAEVRRHLLNYIREHPEELRPYARAARTD